MKKCKIFWIFILILVASCQSEMDKYYELPDWLKGSAYEVLQEEGNFTIFLSAVDKTDFKDLVNGKGVITVMAPTDEAFRAYLAKHGKETIDGFTKDELNKLIGYHLVYYSFSKENFMNYKPNGIESEVKYPGLYFKFRTKSRDAISTAVDIANENALRRIMHKERFLPVFSSNFFASNAVDAKGEYEALYPGSTWQGNNGFNVSNAAVIDYAIITDNGYLYTLDQVIEPLETIYTELSDPNSNYTDFAKIYDRFVSYNYDEDATRDYGNGDSLFVHSHIGLSPIASEWTTSPTSIVPDYAQMANLTSLAYNIIAPDNASLQAFFNKYWKDYYQTLEQVNFYPLAVLVDWHIYRGSLLLPSQVPFYVTGSDYVDGNSSTELGMKTMCVNGVLYGLKNNIMTPSLFESPAAPALRDPQYNMMMMLLNRSSYIYYFQHSYGHSFNVFYPSDNMIVRNSSYGGRTMEYIKGNPNLFGAETINIESDDGMKAISNSQSKGFAGAHISDGILAVKDNGADAGVVYSTLNQFEYLYLTGDKIYSSAIWNNKETVTVPEVEKIATYVNGTAYKLKGEEKGAPALSPEANNFKDVIVSNMKPADYSGFSVYLNMSSVAQTTPAFNFLQGDRFIVFIPSYDAVLKDLTTTRYFPTTGTMDKRDAYIKGMFVNVNSSALYDYPFPGAMNKPETTLKTFLRLNDGNSVKEVAITLVDNGRELILRDSKGNEAKVISYFPYMYADGAAYIIDGVLDLLN